MSTKDGVRAFVLEKICGERRALVGDATSLIDADLLDSTAVVELAAFIQAAFGVEVRDEDLMRANIDSIDAIASFVERRSSHARVA